MSTTTVLVTYRGYTREVALPSDSQLESLWENFSAAFSEFMPLGIEPTQGIFTEILKHGVKLHATLEDGPAPGPIIPHPLNDNNTYNFWSLISKQYGSLMKRNETVINCKGKKVGESNLVNIKAKPASVHDKTLFRLELKRPTKSKVYVITGKGEGQNVYVQEVDASTTPPKDDESRFQAIYYYSYTQFLCYSVDGRDDLYLASDEKGNVTLAKGGPSGYPNPSTLFICNQLV